MIDIGQDRGQAVESLVGKVADEFTERVQRGERPDIEEYARRHPEIADVLRQVLPALQMLRPRGYDEAVDLSTVPGQLGDYRLLREVGRGGMGIVYEAEQISLRRRVALKVLPFAATMDPRQLQRFHNEARAAACLHHEHIVPVYAVGCERAVHFYAMQFIEGKSLAEWIAAEHDRQPASPESALPSGSPAAPASDTDPVGAAVTATAPRDRAYFHWVAALGIQAAQALEHAHSVGIVHRDIKPANLLLDGNGKLWVTDFGLARTAADPGLTMSGDLLGTLRYMSPEQATAQHGLVDHRTDVYSLGATLYELLIGRPVVEGRDHQLVLRRIVEDEHLPLRTMDREVPVDLETIVLKALAKEAADRYATAKVLADDLGRFLDNKPIQARRPTLPQRLRKWSQRHRHLVRLSITFVFMLTVGLAVSGVLLWQEKEQTQKALADAHTNHGRAEAQRRRAETNFREAYWAVQDLLEGFSAPGSSEPADIAELRHWQTERALGFLAPFCEDPGNEPEVRLQKGAALVHTGRVYEVRGERDKAQQAFRRAISVFQRLIQDCPDDPTYPNELGTALCILATNMYQAGKIPEAKEVFAEAISVWRAAILQHPKAPDLACNLAFSLCTWFEEPQLRDLREALAAARTATKVDPQQPTPWLALGAAYYRLGQWQDASRDLEMSLQKGPDGTKWRRTTAALFLAMALERGGRHQDAMEYYKYATERMARILVANNDVCNRVLRAEAAALLGIQDPAIPKVKGGLAGQK